jgi:hypothetical protein
MKEKLLVLAKAAPEASKRYEELVCIAGVTDKGEWRRIYPIPWELFWKDSGKKFMKKQWIEYELVDDKPSDHRPESRKVKFETIKVLEKASFREIESITKPRITTIESLISHGAKTVSLGAIKPELIDFTLMDNKQYEEILGMSKQQTLTGKTAVLEPPEHKYRYIFTDVKGEQPHKMLCEDWELERLYSGCKKKLRNGEYSSIDVVHEKVKDKMFRKITEHGHFYFVVGTHYRFPTYIIVGVLYPRKDELPELDAGPNN